jgi:hypothetical protein
MERSSRRTRRHVFFSEKVFRYGGATGSHRTSVVVLVGEDDEGEERSESFPH